MNPSRLFLAVAGATVLLASKGLPMSTVVVPYEEFFRAEAGMRWLDRAAQCRAESNFNPTATSYIWKKRIVGGVFTLVKTPCAFGIAQFTLPTWREMQRRGVVPVFVYDVEGTRIDNNPDYYDPATAIKAQNFYMRDIEAQFQGDNAKSLGAYNAGISSIKNAERRAASLGYSGSEAWMKALPLVVGKNLKTEKSHAEETIGYVKRIRQYRDEYKKAGLV